MYRIHLYIALFKLHHAEGLENQPITVIIAGPVQIQSAESARICKEYIQNHVSSNVLLTAISVVNQGWYTYRSIQPNLIPRLELNRLKFPRVNLSVSVPTEYSVHWKLDEVTGQRPNKTAQTYCILRPASGERGVTLNSPPEAVGVLD